MSVKAAFWAVSVLVRAFRVWGEIRGAVSEVLGWGPAKMGYSAVKIFKDLGGPGKGWFLNFRDLGPGGVVLKSGVAL